MAGEKDRMVLLEEFMKNTGADRNRALNILNRNQWQLMNSYKEIEMMCISAGQKKVQTTGINHSQGKQIAGSGPQKYNAIEMGIGAAVNLDNKRMVSLPPQANVSSKPKCLPSTRLETLSVAMPSSVPAQSNGHSGNLNQHSTPSSLQPKPPSSGLDKPVHPSFPVMVAPDSHDAHYEEEEDIFDEHFVMKKTVNQYPKLKRGFSNILENEDIVIEARHNVKDDILKDNHDHMYVQTFVLPNLAAYKEGFRAFVEKELIETSTLVSLEQAGRLNWWAEMRICQRLMPMATSGDGNCLLHAASLAMWGIHDRQLVLRKELYDTLTKSRYREALKRRWRYQQALGNKESGLVFSEEEWKEEWENILRLASPLPRGAPDPNRQNNCCDNIVTQGSQDPVVYESLEEFHVFVLAHVLQRPIIVVADRFLKSSTGEALAPIPFSGIFLPFEVHPCYRSPLLLTYDAAHFSALVPVEQDLQVSPSLPAAIPLVDPQLKLLPIHFCVDPMSVTNKQGPVELTVEDRINLLKKMLDVERIPLNFSDSNGDSDVGSCGSQESVENIAINNTRDKEKDRKKDDKKKPGQTVAKQFGSLGKTVGKKLKQLGKGNKEKPRRPSITQSTAITSLDQYNPRDMVLVAKLSEKRGRQHQEMIQNYIQDAQARFKFDHELKRRSDIELRSKVAVYPAATSTTTCRTPGCANFGIPEANFYCAKCNALRQREGLSSAAVNQYSYNTFPGRTRQQNLAPDESFVYGNSKFYTSSNENINQSSNTLPVPEPSEKQVSKSNDDIHRLRGRSPSPDYDNVVYPTSKEVNVSTNRFSTNTSTTVDTKPCTTAGCEFYGNRSSDYMCSKCYKQKYQDMLNTATNTGTKL